MVNTAPTLWQKFNQQASVSQLTHTNNYQCCKQQITAIFHIAPIVTTKTKYCSIPNYMNAPLLHLSINSTQ